MALADIYVLDHMQTFLNEELHNIYTYERLDTGTANDLVAAFIEDVLPLILPLQSSVVKTPSIKAYSLGNLGDLWEETVNEEGGTVDAEILPIFNALGYTFKPTSRAVRPGSKRIAGVPESAQVNGTITLAGYLTAMEALRLAYAGNISDDDANFWAPVVVKRVKYEVPDSDPVRFAYRFPETDGELVSATLRNVTTNTKVRHQTSRGN